MKKLSINDVPNQEPFATPQGYLDSLPHLVQARRNAVTDAVPTAYSGGFSFLRLHLAYVVALLILMASVLFQQSAHPQRHADIILGQVSQQELLNYLSEQDKISVQELSQITSAEALEPYAAYELPNEKEVLEKQILEQIDTYTAEELW